MDKLTQDQWYTLTETVSSKALDAWTAEHKEDTTLGNLLIDAACYVANGGDNNREILRDRYQAASQLVIDCIAHPIAKAAWAGMAILDLCWHLLDGRHSLESTRRLLKEVTA